MYVPRIVEGVVSLVTREVHRVDKESSSGKRSHRRQPESAPTENEGENGHRQRGDAEDDRKVIDEEMRVGPGHHSLALVELRECRQVRLPKSYGSHETVAVSDA